MTLQERLRALFGYSFIFMPSSGNACFAVQVEMFPPHPIKTNADLLGKGLTDQSLAKEFPGKGGAVFKRKIWFLLFEGEN